jgi:hypothetical protein
VKFHADLTNFDRFYEVDQDQILLRQPGDVATQKQQLLREVGRTPQDQGLVEVLLTPLHWLV